MLVLALDTTTRQGSVALTRDGGVLAARTRAMRRSRTASGCPAICCVCWTRTASASPTSICLPWPRALDRSPDCASASRPCRGSRWRMANRSSASPRSTRLTTLVHSLSPQPSALSPDERSRRLDGRSARTGVFGRLHERRGASRRRSVDKPAEILARWARRAHAADGVRRRWCARVSRPHSRGCSRRAHRRAGSAACAEHCPARRGARRAARGVFARCDSPDLRPTVRCGAGARQVRRDRRCSAR